MDASERRKQYQKMVFIFNAIEAGWRVKKRHDVYKFTKKHEGRCEIMNDGYLASFIEANLDLSRIQ